MKFRNGLSYKVEPLKTYELALPKEDVIYRLREQDGYCRNKSTSDQTLEFVCSKKGNIEVCNPNYHKDQHVFLQGEMTTENGKTLVKVFTVKRKGLLFEAIVSAVGSFITTGACLWLMLRFLKDVDPVVWILFAFLLVTTPLSLSRFFKKKEAIPVDTEIMLNEIENRINGVIRWDD